jgi:hypothetical protein
MHSFADQEAEEKVLRQTFQVRLAHEAVMLEDAQQLLAATRRADTRCEMPDQPRPPKPKEDGVIHIGDMTQHIYPDQQSGGMLKKLIPLAAAAALAGTGVGAAVGIPLLINHFFPKTSDTKILTGGAHVIVEPGIVEPPQE